MTWDNWTFLALAVEGSVTACGVGAATAWPSRPHRKRHVLAHTPAWLDRVVRLWEPPLSLLHQGCASQRWLLEHLLPEGCRWCVEQSEQALSRGIDLCQGSRQASPLCHRIYGSQRSFGGFIRVHGEG